MLIRQIENPRAEGRYEDIITLTMTKDQFEHLRDCVTLAYQNAEKDSRMFLISTMIREDFKQLEKKQMKTEKGDKQ